ncbi:hypothetical protein ACLOJK_000263 [Asimina triloba]
MAIYRNPKSRGKPRSPILFLAFSLVFVGLFCFFSSSSSIVGFTIPNADTLKNLVKERKPRRPIPDKFLYWGDRIDCPGKHCDSCEGLGHQESSLRCALEEAMFLKRALVMPSRMCINPIHNKKGILHLTNNGSSEERWAASSCAMDSLYDLDLIYNTVPVILDNSKLWYQVLATSMKLGDRGVAHISMQDRNNRSAISLSYSFLPKMAASKLRDAADRIKGLLGSYDAIHVRRGDKIKSRKDRFGVERSLHPHLDRDTQPEFIAIRIQKWVPKGRTLFIASNERTTGFFSPLSARYKLAYSSNYSSILDPVVENNYQLFMIERLILMGAKTFIKTFKEDDNDLSLTDDPKKNTKNWQIPVYTVDEES